MVGSQCGAHIIAYSVVATGWEDLYGVFAFTHPGSGLKPRKPWPVRLTIQHQLDIQLPHNNIT